MVRYTSEHKQNSHVRIVDAAGRGFRRQGYGGIGVDGLAREAGVTHGAFYGHFRSKAEAFCAAVVTGLDELRAGIERTRAEQGTGWVARFAAFYLGFKRTCALDDACTLPTLSPEVERADTQTRAQYQAALLAVMAATAAGLPAGDESASRARAWALLALLAGGVTLARAVPDPALSAEIAAAVVAAAEAMAGDPETP